MTDPAPKSYSTPPTMMLRANVTGDEWAAFRKVAIDKNTSAADLLGQAIRRTINENGGKG